MQKHEYIEIDVEIGKIFEIIEQYEKISVQYDNITPINTPVYIPGAKGEWVPVYGLMKKTDSGVIVSFSDGSSVNGAYQHKIVVKSGESPVFLGTLTAGDIVEKSSGENVIVIDRRLTEHETFYDLSVDSEDHLYQCSEGFVHHNTEVCKALAHALKDDEGALIRFDMSEYMEKHSVAKLIGAPAGYEGSERGGILTNAMRQNPHRIILFDEIEKADPAVFDLFLQILSDGRLTDNHGRTVNFSESMVIMTTNIGQTFFLDDKLAPEEAERLANVELDSVYRPEFLNRFAGRQNIVCFDRLGLDSIEKIVNRELNGLKNAYKESGVSIEYSNECIKAFCADHYEPRHGARGLQGYIVANIEPLVVNMILENQVESAILNLVYNRATKKFDINVQANVLKGVA